MVVLSWRLSLLSLFVLPPAIWLTRRVALLRREITDRRQRTLADMQTQIEESLSVSGVLLGKTLGTGPASTDRFTERSWDLVDLEVRSQLAGRWRMATMSVVFAAIPAVIYLAAGLPVTAGAMTIGTLVAFVALQSQLFRPLSGLLDVGVSVVSSMALFGRIFEYWTCVPRSRSPVVPSASTPPRCVARCGSNVSASPTTAVTVPPWLTST
jgi:ATP-binding cassette subfamily B protein